MSGGPLEQLLGPDAISRLAAENEGGRFSIWASKTRALTFVSRSFLKRAGLSLGTYRFEDFLDGVDHGLRTFCLDIVAAAVHDDQSGARSILDPISVRYNGRRAQA